MANPMLSTDVKILILATRLEGGAGIASRRLWESLIKISTLDKISIIYRDDVNLRHKQWTRISGQASDECIYEWGSRPWNCEKTSQHLNSDKTAFSSTYISALEQSTPYDQSLIEAISSHTHVNLHWASGLISIDLLQHLKENAIPTLITLHDLNYITGGCHYTAGCRHFEKICEDCPQVNSVLSKEIIRRQHINKVKIFDSLNFYFTGPSEWILNEARRSRVARVNRGNILRASPNPVDDEISTPNPAIDIKPSSVMGTFKIALIAANLQDERKGVSIGINAIKEALPLSLNSSVSIDLHLAGTHDSDFLAKMGIKEGENDMHGLISNLHVTLHGRLPSHAIPSLLCSIDLLLFPSIEENYSNLIVEALKNGVHVLAFAVGGNSEICARYPRIMTVVGSRLNISNGVNISQRYILAQLTRMMSVRIAELIPALRINHRDYEQVRQCSIDHNKADAGQMYIELYHHMKGCYRQLDHVARVPTKIYDYGGLAGVRRFTNRDEPVYWLNKIDDHSIVLPSNSHHVILCVRPYWIESWNSHLNPQIRSATTEQTLFSHKDYSIEELCEWDLALLTIKNNRTDPATYSILNEECLSTLPGLPILIEYIDCHGDPCSFTTVSQLLLASMRGTSLVSPMRGIYAYPHSERFPEDQDNFTITSLSTCTLFTCGIPIDQAEPFLDSPVRWLDSYSSVTPLPPKGCLLLVCHYPSWEPDYLLEIWDDDWNVEILRTIPHYHFAVDNLDYWNTAIVRLASNAANISSLFKPREPSNCALPLSYAAFCFATEAGGAIDHDLEIFSIGDGNSKNSTKIMIPTYTFKSLFDHLARCQGLQS